MEEEKSRNVISSLCVSCSPLSYILDMVPWDELLVWYQYYLLDTGNIC